MATEPTVCVVDDDPAMRESLRWLIESVNLRVETFESAQAFLASYNPERPGCLVLDVRMPGMTGTDLQAELVARGATIPIIIITGYAEVPIAVRAMKAGALDFIEKPFSDQLLLDRIQQAIGVDRARRAEQALRSECKKRLASLTPREREVLDRVVAGRANREIAAELGLSIKTVEVHRAHVMEKMRAQSLPELVRMVIASRDSDPTPPAR